MKPKPTPPQPEFSRIVVVDKIAPNGGEENLDAKENERAKLAERFGLLDLTKLSGHLTFAHTRANQAVEVKGKMVADVVQQCVVTLEPLPGHIEADIHTIFAVPELVGPGAGAPDPNEEDVEPILDGTIDLGELLAQNLGLNLDPYPRKPGAGFVEVAYGDDDPKPASPLAALANWPKKPKD